MSCLHRGPYIQRGSLQRGRGIGSTLRSIFHGVFPAMKSMGRKLWESPVTKGILNSAKNSAIEAGINVVSDTLKGKNVGESLKGNVSTAKKAVTDSLLSALHNVNSPTVKGKNTAKKRKLPIKHIGKKRKKIHGDIFDTL